MPDASYRNVLLALRAVRVAEKAGKITDRWLKSEHGIGQEKQASRLLRFLGFVDRRRRLSDELLAKRHDWAHFRQLVVERVRKRCDQIGVGGDVAFGAGSWDEFERALRRCRAMANRAERSKESVISCFRALADISEMDEESFQAELEKVSSSKDGQRKTPSESDPERTVSDKEFSFPIGRHEDGKIVYARLTFSEPMQPGDFRRLAGILEAMDLPAGR
jgi:hypothetical protein